MEVQDQAVAQAQTVEEGEATTPAAVAARKNKKATAQLESQDDLAYITGKRDPQEAEKQVRTPAPRRQSGKAKEARGERR
jgi:hypothetical protein